MKREFIEAILIQALERAPKNPERAAQFVSKVLTEEFDKLLHRYYQRKYKAFRSKDINVKALMDLCNANKEEYKQDPMSLVYSIEDELIRQLIGFYGEDDA